MTATGSGAPPEVAADAPPSGFWRWILREPAPLPSLTQRSIYPWLVVASVCVGAFMGQLDASIVSLVLPTLEDTFHVHVSAVQWVAIIYLLVLTGLLAPLGRVADHLGRKALYTIGFLIFVAGSALCGLAPSLWFLILARAIQGGGAAMLQANSVAIITAAVPRQKLGRAIGFQGTAQALGLAFGPTIGGLLIAWVGWRWVFLINLPVGLLGSLLALLVLPRTTHHAPVTSFNRLGAVLLPLAIGALLLGLTFLHLAYVMLPLAAGLFLLFVHSERRASSPMIGAQIVRAPGMMLGMLAALLSYTVLFGGLFAVPIQLERVLGQSPDHAGLILTIVPAVLGSVALFGGWLSDHLGPRLPTVGGMLLAAAGLTAIWFAADKGVPYLVPGLALLGLGAGLFIPANNASVMAAAPETHLGVAGGLVNVMRGLGTSFGVALVGMVLALYIGSTPTDQANPSTLIDAFQTTILCLIVAALAACLLVARRPQRRHASRDAQVSALEL